jgi:urease accessory protein
MITSLHIQTALRNGQTYLLKAYATSPLKVADITENKRGGQLELMIMSSSPGILDGDEYDLRIDVAAGCNLKLQTQSYQRLFNMQQGASQRINVHLEPGSSITYMPYPTVPHAGAIFKASNKIYLSDDCSLTWGEVITCGRKLSGEHFKFSKLHFTTDVFISNKLVLKENLVIEPGKTNVSALGQWEGYTHQASLLFIDSNASINELIGSVSDLMTMEENIIYGVSATPVNGLVVRILGYKAEQLFDCLKRISSLLSSYSLKPSPVYAS